MNKKTLALNIIAGPGDSKLLERCLTTNDFYKYFDEIVIIPTTVDEKVLEVAKKFNTRSVDSFSWTSKEFPFGNFGGARNRALELTKSDYIWWTDCDDVYPGDDFESRMKKLRDALDSNNFDVYVMPYILKLNEKGEQTDAIIRERIFRNNKSIKWEFSIHEQLTINWEIHTRADLNGIEALHLPMKMDIVSVNRNLQMLEVEYRKGNAPAHIQFYYARELINKGNRPAAIPILLNIIDSFKDNLIHIYDSALLLANYFIYCVIGEDSKARLRDETMDLGERYLRIALAVSDVNAEPFVYMGDVFYSRKIYDKALLCYKEAMTKKFGSGNLQQVQYYEEIPSRRMATIFLENNQLEQALLYNRIALKCCTDDPSLIDERRKIIKELVKTL